MLKLLSLGLVILLVNESRSVSVPLNLNDGSILLSNPRLYPYENKGQFASHLQDFEALIDLEKLIGVAINYIYDPEVLQFLGFMFSPQMGELILEFESMVEFREATGYLESKGYNMYYLINVVNSALDLPPFEMPKGLMKSGGGVNGLIEDVIASLPLEDMKKLFESKLETSPEVAQLFETINSEEFLGILRRMSQNPKFLDIKAILEDYGFDFKYICQLAIGILGDYYQGVFCM